MSNSTQKNIIKAFEALLEEKSLNKITVLEIVNKCKISPNTFYYHFSGIGELIEYWIYESYTYFLRNSKELQNWDVYLKLILEKLKENYNAVYNVLNSKYILAIEKYICSLSYSLSKKIISNIDADEMSVNAKSEIYTNLFIGLLVRFISNDMKDDIDLLIASLIKSRGMIL